MEISQYLDEYLIKSFDKKPEEDAKTMLAAWPTMRTGRIRRLSILGAIKKTRSIVRTSLSEEVPDFNGRTRSPSPEDNSKTDDTLPQLRISSTNSERSEFKDVELKELFSILNESDQLEEKGDIIQFLAATKGLDFECELIPNQKSVTVRDLLKDLYKKACRNKVWSLVRHMAGMLNKKVGKLSSAVTDLLVRQKQVC